MLLNVQDFYRSLPMYVTRLLNENESLSHKIVIFIFKLIYIK